MSHVTSTPVDFAALAPVEAVNPFAATLVAAPTTKVVSLEQLAARCGAAAIESVQVVVKWGVSVLHAAQLAPVRDFRIGEGEGVDLEVPAERLGLECLALVRVAASGEATASIPAGARARMTAGDERAELGPVASTRLLAGCTLTIEQGDFTFEIAAGAASPRLTSRFGFDRRGLVACLVSAFCQVGLLAATAAAMPPLGIGDGTDITEEQRYTIQHYLASAAEIEREQEPAAKADRHQDGVNGDGTGDAETDSATPADKRQAASGYNRYDGPAPGSGHTDRPMTRGEVLNEAARSGFITMVQELGDMPMDPFSAPTDDLDPGFGHPDGDAWTGRIGDPRSLLSLQSDGEGSDARGPMYSLPQVRTSPSDDYKPSRFRRPLERTGNDATFRLRPEDGANENGRIPAAVIQRIVRSNVGRIAACYETGLRTNPSLTGTVTMRFLINRDGTVGQSAASGMPDPAVNSCIARQMTVLTFPAPGAVVPVSYSIPLVPAGA